MDNNTARHPGDDQMALLSKLTGMEYYQYGLMRDFEGGGFGVGVLSRIPFDQTEVFRYTKPGHGFSTDVRFLILSPRLFTRISPLSLIRPAFCFSVHSVLGLISVCSLRSAVRPRTATFARAWLPCRSQYPILYVAGSLCVPLVFVFFS